MFEKSNIQIDPTADLHEYIVIQVSFAVIGALVTTPVALVFTLIFKRTGSRYDAEDFALAELDEHLDGYMLEGVQLRREVQRCYDANEAAKLRLKHIGRVLEKRLEDAVQAKVESRRARSSPRGRRGRRRRRRRRQAPKPARFSLKSALSFKKVAVAGDDDAGAGALPGDRAKHGELSERELDTYYEKYKDEKANAQQEVDLTRTALRTAREKWKACVADRKRRASSRARTRSRG